jgi:hypothetical protein
MLKGTAEAVQVSDNVTLKDYWKSYDPMKGICNLSAAWGEVSKSFMNGVWRKLWHGCIPDS